MDRVLHIVSRIFTYMFVSDGSGSTTYLVRRVISLIVGTPYLVIGVSLMVIGFSVSLIRRIIHS